MKQIKEILLKLAKYGDKIALVVAVICFLYSIYWYFESAKLSEEFREKSTRDSFGRITKYSPVNTDDYSANKFFAENQLWEKSLKRNKNDKSDTYITDFSDFMKPFKISRSIAEGAGGKLIPYENYLIGICPITGGRLPIPNTKDLSQYTSKFDFDEDGIPDVIEKKMGLNPENSQDALGDIDNDSFTNIAEYDYDKDGILNPKVHPPLIERYVLSEIANTKIPIEIENISKYGYNKNKWTIQIDIYIAGKGWRTKFLKIGDSFEVNGIKYKINDIEEKYDYVVNPKLGALDEIDQSVVLLTDSLGQEINAVVDKNVFEPNRRIVLQDLYTGKKLITKIDNTISIGDSRIGIEKYKLISVDDRNDKLVFEGENGKKFTVTKESNYEKPK